MSLKESFELGGAQDRKRGILRLGEGAFGSRPMSNDGRAKSGTKSSLGNARHWF